MTVVSRTFRGTPHRDAAATWSAIVSLLTQDKASAAATELASVAGIAASVIADGAVKNAPIVVTCDGPRTRIYCLYDDDALDESSANESPLGFDPLQGEWHVSMPCQAEDLGWVNRALRERSARVTARDLADGFAIESTASASEGPASSWKPMTVDTQELFK
jgi:hypothetical protein